MIADNAFLKQAFARLALIAFLFLFGLFDLFKQITSAVTMHPGFTAIFAQRSGNGGFIHFEACKNKQRRKVSRQGEHDQ